MKVARVNARRDPILSSPFGVGGGTAQPALGDLSDVDLTGLADGDIIVYDVGSNTWVVANGTTGDFLTKNEGGQDFIEVHGNTGGTETFDPTDGNVHTATLDADCTFTLNAPVGSGAATIELYLTQDGTGSRLVTWPGSVVWPGGTAPTLSTAAGAVDRIIVETLDGGTTWYGVMVGGGGSGVSFATPAIVLGTAAAAGAASTVIRSDSTIVAFDSTAPANVANVGVASSTGSVAKAARRDHAHALTYHDEPLTDGASNFIFDGGDIVVVTGVPN